MVLCVYMACVWVVLHVYSYVFLAWGIPRGGMNCPGHLNLWMKVLIHQQLPVWRWTAPSTSGSQSGKGRGWNRESRVIQSRCFTQQSHLPEDTAAPSVSACVQAVFSQPRFQPCLLRGWEMNGEAIRPGSRDSSYLSGAAGLVVFECDPQLGLATLESYFLGTWKSFLCCVHTRPRVLTHAHEYTQSCWTPLWSYFPSVQWKV